MQEEGKLAIELKKRHDMMRKKVEKTIKEKAESVS
jgi:hypothetical protein